MNHRIFGNKNNKRSGNNKINKTTLELICLSGLLASNISFAFSDSSIIDTKQSNRILKVSHQATDNHKPSFNDYDKHKAQFSRDYEFIFFYNNSCSHCKSFEPILKIYSDNFGINVRSFVIGGDPSLNPSSSYFPDSTVANQKMLAQFFGLFNFSEKGNGISVPALFIMNKNNLHAYPVSQGALTYLELVKRMNELKPQILRHEYNMAGRENKNN